MQFLSTIRSVVLAISLCLGILFSSVSANAFCVAGETQHVITTSEGDRDYAVFHPDPVPPVALPAQMPVVYAFHGSADNQSQAEQWRVDAELMRFATEAEVIVVAPLALTNPYSGTKLVWYAGDQIQQPAHDDNILVTELMAHVDSQGCTSDERYALGYSAGGGFASQMACLQNGEFERIGAYGLAYFDASCTASGDVVPAIYVHNVVDKVVLYPYSLLMFQEYAARHGCYRARMKPDPFWEPSVKHEYRCNNVDLRHHRLNFQAGELGSLDHAWPTESNSGTNATEVMFKFFGLL